MAWFQHYHIVSTYDMRNWITKSNIMILISIILEKNIVNDKCEQVYIYKEQLLPPKFLNHSSLGNVPNE